MTRIEGVNRFLITKTVLLLSVFVTWAATASPLFDNNPISGPMLMGGPLGGGMADLTGLQAVDSPVTRDLPLPPVNGFQVQGVLKLKPMVGQLSIGVTIETDRKFNGVTLGELLSGDVTQIQAVGSFWTSLETSTSMLSEFSATSQVDMTPRTISRTAASDLPKPVLSGDVTPLPGSNTTRLAVGPLSSSGSFVLTGEGTLRQTFTALFTNRAGFGENEELNIRFAPMVVIDGESGPAAGILSTIVPAPEPPSIAVFTIGLLSVLSIKLAGKRHMLAFRRHQTPVSIASCRCWARFAVAQAVQRRDPGLVIAGNLANVGLISIDGRMCHARDPRGGGLIAG